MYRHLNHWSTRHHSVLNTDPITRLVTWLSARHELWRGYKQCPPEIKEIVVDAIFLRNTDPLYSNIRTQFVDDEVIDIVSAVQSSEDKLARLSEMKRSDIKLIVDFYSEALELYLYKPMRVSLFQTLRKLCAAKEIFPRSFLISSAELRRQDYVAGGGFADVWRGIYKGRNVALKLSKLPRTEEMSSARQIFVKEAVCWKYISHPNIVQFLGVEDSSSTLCLVSEWMENGTVGEYLQKNPHAERLPLLLDIAKGLQYLHSDAICIIHGDLKSFNIMIDREHRARLADFGLASIPFDSNTTNIMTSFSRREISTRWAAPELLLPENFGLEHVLPSRASDVYALGMVMWEIFSGTIPYDRRLTNAQVILRIIEGERPPRPEHTAALGLSDRVWELMSECWREDHRTRPRIQSVRSAIEGIMPIPETTDDVVSLLRDMGLLQISKLFDDLDEMLQPSMDVLPHLKKKQLRRLGKLLEKIKNDMNSRRGGHDPDMALLFMVFFGFFFGFCV